MALVFLQHNKDERSSAGLFVCVDHRLYIKMDDMTVAGPNIGHKSHPLHVSSWDMDQT